MLRTAILRGLRPTTLLKNRQPYSKWNDEDRRLLQAYQIFEDEIGRSNLPYFLTHSDDPDLEFRVEERQDRGMEALEDYDKKNKDDKRKGINRFVVVYGPDGTPLDFGGFEREGFSKQTSREEELRQEGVEIEYRRPEGGYDASEYGDD